MLLFRILNFFAGYKDIVCSPETATSVVNFIVKNDLDYWNMRRSRSGELRFSMLNSEFRRLRSLCGDIAESGIRVEKNNGLPHIIYCYRKRIGIPVGIILFIFLVRLSTMYIWEVSVSGNEKISDAEVIDSLEALGCSIGTYIPSVDFYNICHEFILANEDVSWISVNMVGTTAKVEIIERRAKESIEDDGNGTPTNIIAARDGIIVRTETASGKTAVKAGENVKKGQLLVSGVVEIGRDDDGRFVLVRSRGRIYAQTERSLEVTVPLKSVKKIFSGTKNLYKYLNFFGKNIKLKENSSILPDDCDIIEDKRRLILFEGGKITGGIALPVSVVTGYYEEYTESEVTLTPEEALAEAKIEMAELFTAELGDAEILSRNETYELCSGEDGDELVLVWNLVCVENIAEEVPIGVS